MVQINRRCFLLGAVGTLTAHCVPALATAENAPELKSLQLFVPTPPGTQPDLIARWLAGPISSRARIPVTVQNRPGAAGAIAADAVLGSAPESGTLLLGGLDHVAYSHLNSDRRALDPFVDFVPVGTTNRDSWLVVTSGETGPASVAELFGTALARGPLSYASNGEGSTSHLLSARLCRAAGVPAQHVAYRESFLPDLIAGRTAFAVMPAPGGLPLIRAGKLRALGALTRQRVPQLPNVATLGELGFDGQTFHGGLFLFAPASLSAQARRINRWLVEAQSQPEVIAAYENAAIDPMPLDLDRTRQAVAERLQIIEAMRKETFGRGRTG